MFKLRYIQLIKFVILTFFVAFSVVTNAQENRVIDNKGTLKTIGNNRVFTTIDKSEPIPEPDKPVEGDIWYNLEEIEYKVDGKTLTTTVGPIKVYEVLRDKDGNPIKKDGKVVKQWKKVSYKGQKGSVFFADDNGYLTENNKQFYWDNKEKQFYVGSRPDFSTKIKRTKLNTVGAITATSGFKANNGSKNVPSFRFYYDTNTGMFMTKPNSAIKNKTGISLGFSVKKHEVLRLVNENALSTPLTVEPFIYRGAIIDGEARIKTLNTGTKTNTLLVADNKGVVKKINFNETASKVETTLPPSGMASRTIAVHTSSDVAGTVKSITETVTEMEQVTSNSDGQTTGTKPTAKTIATYKDESGASTKINETVTSISQNKPDAISEATETNKNGFIKYKAENQTTEQTVARVVSANTGNALKVGTDGGAYLEKAPRIRASGSVQGINNTGNVTIEGTPYPTYTVNEATNIANVLDMGQGRYKINFVSEIPTPYIVLITVEHSPNFYYGPILPDGNGAISLSGPTYHDADKWGFWAYIKDTGTYRRRRNFSFIVMKI